jgi:hypothetical protein
MSDQEKTAGQVLRERFWAIKKSIKPSKELLEIFQKKEKSPTEKENPKKKVARPFTPEAGA